MRRDLTTFIEQIGNPPALPAIYYELLRVMAQTDSSLDNVSELILQDQSLTARTLRLANSALFGCSSQVGTITEAVQLLGLREVQKLVLATSVVKAFRGFPPGLLDLPGFWRHSVACGLGSALLAKRRHHPAPESLFIGGLLHDIGRLMICLGAPSESQEILERSRSNGQVAMQVEREVLGFDHAALGAELAWVWKLPHTLIDIIEGHHAPPQGSAHALDTWLVHYADFIVNVLEIGQSGEFYVPPLHASGPEGLLNPDELEVAVAEIETECDGFLPILLDAA